MSSLWTPSGGEPARPAPPMMHDGATEPTPPVTHDEAAELQRLQAQLRATPVADLVANHAIGLWQLAVLHLGIDDPATLNLAEANLAIDAVAAIVDGLGARLGEHAEPLAAALTQLRLAFVQQTRRLQGS